mmetsp:Transcript_42943/g.100261  ORF Transcript_42943/g.100261 Transcript_42943/m.100261 type:complete len:170 (+) Transcript_42943:59-568(+)|eukprot:s3516_g3.t1
MSQALKPVPGRRDLGFLQKEWQNEVQLPSFFHGGAGCPEGRGVVAKRIAVQCRSSLNDEQVVPAKAAEDYAAVISCLPAGGDDPPMRGVRCYTSAPNQQSIMDSILFNRVFDWRSREQHDKAFKQMYGGAAGRISAGVDLNGKRVKYSTPWFARPKTLPMKPQDLAATY